MQEHWTKSGNRGALKGKSLHAMCADGATSCRVLGYRFKIGNATYLVLEVGQLQVAVGGKVVLDESGGMEILICEAKTAPYRGPAIPRVRVARP